MQNQAKRELKRLNSDKTVGKSFEQIFPNTAAGIKTIDNGGVHTNVTPTLTSLSIQAKELKTHYDIQARTVRAFQRQASNVEQRLSLLENWILQFEKTFQGVLDSESEQLNLLRVLRQQVSQARTVDELISKQTANPGGTENRNNLTHSREYMSNQFEEFNQSSGRTDLNQINPDKPNINNKSFVKDHPSYRLDPCYMDDGYRPSGHDDAYPVDDEEYPTNGSPPVSNHSPAATSGFIFMMSAVPVEEFHGYIDEDLLSWLTKFEDYFNINRDSRVQPHVHVLTKANHLIAKLQDPARSRIKSLTPEQRKSYTNIVELLKKLYLTETTKVHAMNELQATTQGTTESVQHFANRISKIIDRANHDNSDTNSITRQKVSEFVYRSKYMAKLCLKHHDTFEDVVTRALKLEQLDLLAEGVKRRLASTSDDTVGNKDARKEPQAHIYADLKFPSENPSSERTHRLGG